MDLQADEKFLAAMGLKGLPDDKKQKALDDILYALNIKIANRVLDKLNEEQLTEFERLTSEDPSQEKISEWLTKNVPNYLSMAEEETQKLRDETLQIVDKVMRPQGTK